MTVDAARASFNFLLFEFHRPYLLVNFFNLILQVFLGFLGLFELLFNGETMVSLQDLFVHEVAPGGSVHLVVKEVGVEVLHPEVDLHELLPHGLLLVLLVLHVVVDLHLQLARLLLLLDLLDVVIEADFTRLGREVHLRLPLLLKLLQVFFHHALVFHHQAQLVLLLVSRHRG